MKVRQLSASLHGRVGVQMASAESRLDVQLCCKDAFAWIFFPCCNCPIDDLLEGRTKVTRHQFGGVHAAVDGRPRLPFPALVVGESILWDDFATFVDHLLELDVQWSKEYAGDLLDLVKRER